DARRYFGRTGIASCVPTVKQRRRDERHSQTEIPRRRQDGTTGALRERAPGVLDGVEEIHPVASGDGGRHRTRTGRNQSWKKMGRSAEQPQEESAAAGANASANEICRGSSGHESGRDGPRGAASGL